MKEKEIQGMIERKEEERMKERRKDRKRGRKKEGKKERRQSKAKQSCLISEKKMFYDMGKADGSI